MERLDVFQDNYGYWRARRGELQIGEQRLTRDEAMADMETMYVDGDLCLVDGATSRAGGNAHVPAQVADVAQRGLAAGTGPNSIPEVSIEQGPGVLGPLVPAL